MTKIPAVAFEIGFSECPNLRAQKFTEWETINRALRLATRHIKEDMLGYYKTDFKVTYADGQVYEGRFDLTAKDLVADIGSHMLEFLECYSGRRVPRWMTLPGKENYLKAWKQDLETERKEQAEAAGKFLDLYEIKSFGGSTGS